MSLAPELLAILVCPQCKGTLTYQLAPTESLVCASCRLVYAVQDGIPVMLIDEAQPWSGDAGGSVAGSSTPAL
jgi:uncharacterized protein